MRETVSLVGKTADVWHSARLSSRSRSFPTPFHPPAHAHPFPISFPSGLFPLRNHRDAGTNNQPPGINLLRARDSSMRISTFGVLTFVPHDLYCCFFWAEVERSGSEPRLPIPIGIQDLGRVGVLRHTTIPRPSHLPPSLHYRLSPAFPFFFPPFVSLSVFPPFHPLSPLASTPLSHPASPLPITFISSSHAL